MEQAFSNMEKAAGMLICMGIDKAAQVLSFLSQDEVQMLANQITRLGRISTETRRELIIELKERYRTGGWSIDPGGLDYVRKLLSETFDPERAEMLIEQLMQSNTSRPFASLRRVDARRIMDVISNEHPSIVALVLYYLPREKAAQVVCGLPEGLRNEAVMRLVNMQTPVPHMVAHLEQLILQRLSENHGDNEDEDLDVGNVTGARTLVEILGRTDSKVEHGVYNYLQERNPDLAEEVRKSMFVFEDLTRLSPRSLQTLLRELSPQELALAMKKSTEELKEAVFGNVSENAAKMIREEQEMMGPVRLSMVDEAQQKVVSTARRLADEGTIELVSGDKEEEMV
ncbi:MAG: flagellar motor switch protein FliG [Armatimonadota bacterium]